MAKTFLFLGRSLRGHSGPAEPGYAALLSVIVLGVILAAATLGFSGQVAAGRQNSLDRVRKGQSRAAAEGCSAKALLYYALDPGYAGDETIAVNGTQCVIKTITSAADTISLVVAVNMDGAMTTLATVANKNDTAIISQYEIIN